MEGLSFADTINGQGVFFPIKYLTASLKQSLYVAHMPKVSSLLFYRSVQSLSPISLHTPYVCFYVQPAHLRTPFIPQAYKKTSKHFSISIPNLFSSSCVWVGEAKGRGWGRKKSQRVAGTAEDMDGEVCFRPRLEPCTGAGEQ